MKKLLCLACLVLAATALAQQVYVNGVPQTFSLWGLSIPQPTVNGTVLTYTTGPAALSWGAAGPTGLSNPITGSLLFAPSGASIVGSLTGVTISNYVTLSKTPIGFTVNQGDWVLITGGTTTSNYGWWLSTGGNANAIGVAPGNSGLAGSDTNVSLTVYRNIFAVTPQGEPIESTVLTDTANVGAFLSLETAYTSGSGVGLELFFGSNTQPSGWGSGDTNFSPLRIYRHFWRDNAIFDVDAEGNAVVGGSLSVPGGLVRGANVTASQLTTPTAPTVTPCVAGG